MLRTYHWGLDASGTRTGAGGIQGLLAIMSTNSGASFYAYDGNGNVAALISATDGSKSAVYDYDPYGNTIRRTGLTADENPYHASTKRDQTAVGLTLYEYRQLRAGIGRWLSRDPIGEMGGKNLYSFVSNDPVAKCDPFGLADRPFEFSIDMGGCRSCEFVITVSWNVVPGGFADVKVAYTSETASPGCSADFVGGGSGDYLDFGGPNATVTEDNSGNPGAPNPFPDPPLTRVPPPGINVWFDDDQGFGRPYIQLQNGFVIPYFDINLHHWVVCRCGDETKTEQMPVRIFGGHPSPGHPLP